MKRNSTFLLLIAYFAFVLIGLPGGVFNIAWTYMQKPFDVSLDSLGVLMGAGTIGYLFMSFISGRLVVRLGLGRVLLLGGGLMLVGLLGYVLAVTWGVLLVAACIASMGSALIDSGLNTFISANYSTSRLNWLHAAFGLGATIGPIMVTFIVVTLGQSWRIGYGILVALLIGFCAIMLFTLPQWTLKTDEKHETAQKTESDRRGISILETLRVPAVLLSITLVFVYGGLEVGAGQLSNTLFVEGRGITQETAGFWISFYWLSFTIGRTLVGFLADRVPNLTLLRVGMFGSVIGAALLWLNFSPAVGFFGLSLLGFSQAPIFPTLIAETPGRVGARHTPNTVGFQLGSTSLGIAMLPGLAAVFAKTNAEIIGPFLFVVALVMVAIHEFIVFQGARAVVAPAATD
jgi:fucose permease